MAVRGAETGSVRPARRATAWFSRHLSTVPLPDSLERFFAPLPDAGAARHRQERHAFLALTAMWFLMARGDDAAVGRADDPHLLRDRRHGRAARASLWSIRWCWSPAICRSGSSPRSGFAGLTIAHAVASRRSGLLDPVIGIAGAAALGACRALPVQRPQGGLPEEMPEPVRASCSRAGATRPAGVFRLGVEQGVWCLGCCWALMLVMFAVGVDERVLDGAARRCLPWSRNRPPAPLATRLAGAILLVWASGAASSLAVSAQGGFMADQSWAMKGELVLSCNCTVFCPCVLSLGTPSADRGLLPDLGGVPHRCRPFRRGRPVRPQSRPDHGDSPAI